MVESWLISATEYIAIDNTPLRPGIHVDGKLLVNLCQEKKKIILYIFVALVVGARVNWVIPCDLPEYINYVSLVIRSIHVPLLYSVAGGDMVYEFCIPKHVTKKTKKLDGTLKRVHIEVSGLSSSDDESLKTCF